MNKYDFNLDMDSTNSLSAILKRIKNNTIVLEFGTANGRMSKYLNETLNCKVYGVEIDANAAKDAKTFCEKIIVNDVENYTWLEVYKDLKFDYIVFADVLEHLYYPDKVLTAAKSLLHEDGSIFMSIPNIAHNAIIMELLNNKFTYQSIGLLDNTHIRFFTKNTIDELIKKVDLEIEYETGIYISPEKTEFGYYYDDIDNSFGSVLANKEYGEVYQFIIEAKNKSINPFIDFKRIDNSTLFLDTGEGFNEHQIEMTSFLYQEDSAIIFNLNKSIENVKSIRIDPIENTLILKINKILINNIEIKEDIRHNGIYNHTTHEIVFPHNDPHIIIDFKTPQQVNNVALIYDYLTKAYDRKDQQIEIIKQDIQNRDHQIQEKDHQIQEKDHQIQEKDHQIQEKDHQIQEKDHQIQEKDLEIQQQLLKYDLLKDEYTSMYVNINSSFLWKFNNLLKKIKKLFI